MDDDVKPMLRELIKAMRSHLESLEKDLDRDHGSPEANKWDRPHGAFAICLCMKGLTALAANFCKEAQLSIPMLEAADEKIAEVEGKTKAKAVLGVVGKIFEKIPDDNPNKDKLIELLNRILGSDEETRH